jgi:hypothetical protein
MPEARLCRRQGYAGGKAMPEARLRRRQCYAGGNATPEARRLSERCEGVEGRQPSPRRVTRSLGTGQGNGPPSTTPRNENKTLSYFLYCAIKKKRFPVLLLRDTSPSLSRSQNRTSSDPSPRNSTRVERARRPSHVRLSPRDPPCLRRMAHLFEFLYSTSISSRLFEFLSSTSISSGN